MNIQTRNAVKHDYWVGRAAGKDGRSRNEIALMLATGSPTAKWIRKRQGVQKATEYVNRTALAACSEPLRKRVGNHKRFQQDVELGE